MSNLTDFKKYELYPALFNRIDQVFPNRDFRLRGNVWGSPYKLNGEKRSRWNKTYIRFIAPSRIAENGEDSSGVELIDFYMSENNLSFLEAMEALCKIAGLQLPQMEDSESHRAYKEKQERLERIASKMEAALYTDEGAATLSYLRESRGYTDEFIKWAGFGFVSPSFEAELRDLFKDGTPYPSGLGKDFTLSITYRTSGTIQGFQFRTIDKSREKDKYRLLFISKNAAKKYYLFGLTGINLTGNRERDREITIVEGEIDALRALYNGLPNVVAASGGEVSAEAISEALRRGIDRVTLLYDTGEGGTDNKIERAIATIQKAGLKCYVATFPSPDGGKVDADSYLRDHSGDELKWIVYDAISADMWLYYRLRNKFAEAQPEDGYDPDGKQIDDFTTETLALCNKESISSLDRTKILSGYAAISGVDLQTAADKLKEADLKIQQKQKTINLTGQALKLAQDGKVDEALNLIQSKAPQLQRMSKEVEYRKDLTPPTIEEIRRRLRERPTGAKTDYYFKTKYGEQQLVLPSGALTLICGQTSHGKSRMLENLALQLTTNGEAGDVLYFTFEEDDISVIEELTNIYANIELTRYNNNLLTIQEYHAEGKTQYFREDTLSQFLAKEEEVLRLIDGGRLRIFSKYNDGEQLSEAIRYYSTQIKIKAVFVDYIQLMRVRGAKTTIRKDELRDICEMLKDLAKDLGLPVVLAGQLNRDAKSPVEMSCQNLADASDIEHSANIVMLLWNSSVKPKESSHYTTDKNGKERLSDEAQRLAARGFNIGHDGQIYARLDKNRGGERYIDAVFDFNGNTGRISQKDAKNEAEISAF